MITRGTGRSVNQEMTVKRDKLAEQVAIIVRDELGVKADEPPMPVDYAIGAKVVRLLRREYGIVIDANGVVHRER